MIESSSPEADGAGTVQTVPTVADLVRTLDRLQFVPLGQDAAIQEGVAFVLDEPGQLGAGAGLGAGDEAGRMLLHLSTGTTGSDMDRNNLNRPGLSNDHTKATGSGEANRWSNDGPAARCCSARHRRRLGARHRHAPDGPDPAV